MFVYEKESEGVRAYECVHETEREREKGKMIPVEIVFV